MHRLLEYFANAPVIEILCKRYTVLTLFAISNGAYPLAVQPQPFEM